MKIILTHPLLIHIKNHKIIVVPWIWKIKVYQHIQLIKKLKALKQINISRNKIVQIKIKK